MTSSDTKLPPDHTWMTTIAFLPSRQSHAPILPVFTSSKHLTNSIFLMFYFSCSILRMVLDLIEKQDTKNCKNFAEIEKCKYETVVDHLNSFQCKIIA